jgi:uncharacterized protein YqcC (DUF446 family)
MRQGQLWRKSAPSVNYQASTVPFAADCLALSEWLQFVFLPKMHDILDSGTSLPDRCAIAPMLLTEGCGEKSELRGLQPILEALDEAITQAS